MANQHAPLKFQIRTDIVDTNTELLDENNFYNQRHGTVEELTATVTYLVGQKGRKYPLSTMTVGGMGFEGTISGGGIKELDSIEYTYPTMGKRFRPGVTASMPYSVGDKPGLGGQVFDIWFRDNNFKRFWYIAAPDGTMLYLHDSGVQDGAGYRYKAQLDPAEPGQFVDLELLKEGVQWTELFTGVAESESLGTTVNMTGPGAYKNQMGFQRLSLSWAGNAGNKVTRIKLEGPNGETSDLWMDHFMFEFEDKWTSMLEHEYWYSKYNRNEKGVVDLKDLITGKVITKGSGLLEQIPNFNTFSKLTYDYLSNNIGDVLFSNEYGAKNITLYTGTGGFRDFHHAMLEKGAVMLTDFSSIADKFVTGTGYNLALGGYFDAFYHIDGHYVKVKKVHIFDHGQMAQISPKHPVTGLPLESHRMVFIEDSDEDGRPNLQVVGQKGRIYLHGVQQGLTSGAPRSITVAAGGNNLIPLSTEMDKSSYHRFRSSGIQMMNAANSFDFQCIAGL